MNRYLVSGAIAAAIFSSCAKDIIPGDDAWINDDTKPVPVLFASKGSIQASTRAIKDGLVTGNVMNSLDVGIISVAEKLSDGTQTQWNSDVDGSILIDNKLITTSTTGDIVFSPKIYYPFGNKYAFSFYSYYPYRNNAGETAAIADGAYTITYDLGNTDILWASSQAADYNGINGYNAAYCRAVKLGGAENEYYPKLQYNHLLTAMVFKIVSKDEDIENYDVKVTGMEIINTSTSATLCICDNAGAAAGTLTGSEDGGRIGFTNLDYAPTFTETELCTIIAMPAKNYTAAITLTVDGANVSTVELPLGSTDGRTNYAAGYIYSFTVTINNPQEVTIVETGLTEWQEGSNPTTGSEI